jgi:phosphatidylglycerol:prolipoprotein diacylglycerol transferase
MFVHTLDPIAFEVFGYPIRYYGLVYAIGFLIAYAAFMYVAKKGLINNLNKDNVVDLMLVVIVSVVVGARLGNVIFYNLPFFLEHPLQIIMLQRGGMSFHGSLVGLILGFLWFSRRYKVSFYELMDYAVVIAALFLGFGRIANFINAELYGIVTTVPWAVKFPGVSGFRHPTQLYESLQSFFMFAVLFAVLWLKMSIRRTKQTVSRFKTFLIAPGTIAWLFIFLYGTIRFFIEFYKDLDIVLGLRIGQWLCLAMVVVSSVALARRVIVFMKK